MTKAVTAPAGDGRAGDALSYADEELRADATIVLAAVKVAPMPCSIAGRGSSSR